MSSLSVLTNKTPIVSTFDTKALRTSASDVRDIYDWHAATYVEQPALTDLRESFIQRITTARTPKACIIAPFGYGKTTTAIGMWKACQSAGILAVPPVSCTSFPELAHAVSDWLRFILPNYQQEIETAHDKFLSNSTTTLARRDERLFGIPYDQAAAAIRDKLERGYLDFEDASINLLAFLERATELALQAGYLGLVVMIDEFQQLIGNAGKGVLVALRQLIWGLRTRHLPLGLLITMDTDTERTLADRAGDILHRIKDDGLYLDIRHIYDRDFPARLWSQYTEAFNFAVDAQGAIDRPALDALGQLCERDDLSNGPRTVINVLQCAVARREAGSVAGYTPLDLAEDLVQGNVRFDGDRGVIPALVGELLSFPYFQRSAERKKALMLISTFPRGCSRQIAKMYALQDAWDEINEDLRGEIITELDEGIALIELQKVGRPANKLNVMLRRYWMQITDQQIFAEDAPHAFAEIVLPLIFPPKIHDLNGWIGSEDVRLSAEGGYVGVLEGSPSSRYPLRRVGVVVTMADAPIPNTFPTTDIDFKIIFRLNLSPDAVSSVIASPLVRAIEFNFAVGRRSEQGLRGGLAWIEHYLNPQPISPAVILSLLRYFAKQEGESIPERDQARIDDTITRLQEWLLAELLPPDFFENAGFGVVQAGQGALKEFLHLFSLECWPDYRSLIVHQHWRTLMSDYETALRKVSQPIRMGASPLGGTKADIAQLFGQERHAGFESRARQYGDLLVMESWKGSDATIRFRPHPAEMAVVGEVRHNGPRPKLEVYEGLRSRGFSSQEAEQLLRLATLRGMLMEHEASLVVPELPNDAELAAKLRTLKSRLDALIVVPNEFKDRAELLIEAIQLEHEPLEMLWQLERAEEYIFRGEEKQLQEATSRWQELHSKLVNALPALSARLSPAVLGDLSKHLGALYKQLEVEREQLRSLVERHASSTTLDALADAESVLRRVSSWKERADLYERWNTIAQKLTRLLISLARLKLAGTEDLSAGSSIRLLVREARSILAQEGIKGLGEVGRLEADLIVLEQEYKIAGSIREGAYERIATDLCSKASDLVGLSTPLVPPAYDPADDETSFENLYEAISMVVSRAVLLLGVELSRRQYPSAERLRLAKLQADIRVTARSAGNPDWLIIRSQSVLQAKAIRTISSIRVRILDLLNRTASLEPSVSTPLSQTLSAMSLGPVEVSSLIHSTNGSASSDSSQLLDELIRLHNGGILRLLVDLPEIKHGGSS